MQQLMLITPHPHSPHSASCLSSLLHGHRTWAAGNGASQACPHLTGWSGPGRSLPATQPSAVCPGSYSGRFSGLSTRPSRGSANGDACVTFHLHLPWGPCTRPLGRALDSPAHAACPVFWGCCRAPCQPLLINTSRVLPWLPPPPRSLRVTACPSVERARPCVRLPHPCPARCSVFLRAAQVTLRYKAGHVSVRTFW